MIGIIEIIFIVIVFVIIWFAIFRFKIIYDAKNILINMASKIDKQNEKLVISGNEVYLEDKIVLPDDYVSPEDKKKKEEDKEAEKIIKAEIEKIEVVEKPVNLEFTKKSGEKVNFKAKKIVEVIKK